MKCTDKRDNLYALYGLLRWIFPEQSCVNLVADYSLSATDAYIKATATILSNSDYLLITGLAESENHYAYVDLPSGVPLYGESPERWTVTFASHSAEINASLYRRKFQQEFRHILIGRYMIVHGFEFCRVTECPKQLSDMKNTSSKYKSL